GDHVGIVTTRHCRTGQSWRRNGIQQLSQHLAELVTVNQAYLGNPLHLVDNSAGELATVDEYPARGASSPDNPKKLMHLGVRDLIGIPSLALHDDMLVPAIKLQVDTTVVTCCAATGADVLNAIPLFFEIARNQ